MYLAPERCPLLVCRYSRRGRAVCPRCGLCHQDSPSTSTASAACGIDRTCPCRSAEYVELVKKLNPDGALRAYPGSPWIAQQMLRKEDRLRLFRIAQQRQPSFARTTSAKPAAAYRFKPATALPASRRLLPPPPRRALVLIDPSYEDKHDSPAGHSVSGGCSETLCDRHLCALVSANCRGRNPGNWSTRLKKLRPSAG